MEFFFARAAAAFILGAIFIVSILWIIAIIDIVRSDFRGANDKLLWIVIVLIAPILGAILYFIIGRSNKVKYN